MFRERFIVTVIGLPLGLLVVYLGGWLYVLAVALGIALAAREYALLFRSAGQQPALPLVVLGSVALILGRALNGFETAIPLLTAGLLASMAWHLVAYERGRDPAAVDFTITLTGLLYFGWLGGYLISLRDLPGGWWWFLLTLPSVWLADTGAYMIGKQWGRHPLSQRLSPKKTWEGFWAGVVSATLGSAGLALLWNTLAGGAVTMLAWHGALMGLTLALLTPLGDLGESMVKRLAGAKDSGKLLPGHGGAWDRIDTWLWAAALGYYLITWWFV